MDRHEAEAIDADEDQDDRKRTSLHLPMMKVMMKRIRRL